MIRLDGEDLDLGATAAYLEGRVADTVAALQQAQQLHARQGDHRRAARSAFWLGFLLLGRGELAQGSGWLARARRLLEHEPPDCPEHGYLLLPAAMEELGAGDHAAAQATAARAAGIGHQAGEADLVAMAQFFQGAAAVAGGEVAAGLALLDEAMVAAVAGELSIPVTGTIYCGVLEVCQQVAELRRAREWTAALSAWCDSQPDLVAFTGQCLVHRAEILRLGGAWPEAVEAARRAAERLTEADDELAIGAASYQQAEAHRVLGELDAAEDGYQRRAAGATSPSPGWPCSAWPRAAARRPRRPSGVLAETGDRLARARLLPAAVEILLATGDLDEARAAAAELAVTADQYGTWPWSPRPTTPGGRVPGRRRRQWRCGGRCAARVAGLARAGAPTRRSPARLLIGLACRELGDEDAAAMELDAARWCWPGSGRPDLDRLDRLAGPPRRPVG